MANFTNNYCPNPSGQLGLQGFSSLNDALLTLDTTNILYGNQSCFVTCPGEQVGEGCILPGGVIPGSSTCAASCHLTGSGTVTVYAVTNPGGTIVASTQCILTGSWQRIILENINCSPGQTLYLMCKTNRTQPCQFWISGIQCEDSSPSHPYCDGDRDGCEWVNPYRGGPSLCSHQNPIVADSSANTYSDIVNILDVGERFYIESSSSTLTLSDLVYVAGPGPVAAVTDFSVAQLTDPDPAQTYVSWNNAYSNAGTSGAYDRIWSIFYPPVDYLVSNGQYLYKRAAYFAAGWWFASVPAAGSVYLTRVQSEILPVTTGYLQPSPSSFDPPRAIHPLIKPDRLNYCPNPSIETSTSGWVATGSASIIQDGTVSVGDIIEHDDNMLTAGTKSLKVTVNADDDGAQITIADLITGNIYIVSAYVQAGQGMSDILMTIANGSASVISTGGTGYGAGGYGAGPYGGFNPGSDMPLGVWYRINCTFTATSDSEVLTFIAATSVDVSLPSDIWVDAVLIEEGELLQFYFDGNFGAGQPYPDYLWEGTANLSRSYYYNQITLRQQAVINVLNEHIPLGISYDAPQYGVPPIA